MLLSRTFVTVAVTCAAVTAATLDSVDAASISVRSEDIAAMTKLVTFDGATGTTWKWKDLNDPVMGGQSSSTWNIDAQGKKTASWVGEVRIVPSLKAPGFCNAETTNWFAKFNDASPYTHLLVSARTNTPSYAGFKVSFAADTLNPQFKSYKANFNLSGTDFQIVAIPFSSGFSNDWSAYTGDCDTKDPTGTQHHCCSTDHPEVCVTKKNLRDISQVGLWAEGHAAKFDMEVQWIGAGNLSALARPQVSARLAEFTSASPPSPPSTCSGPVQKNLRFNVSGRLAKNYLPDGAATDESLAQAICCDPYFRPFAEPSGFFARPDVNLFASLKEGDTITFYDSVCGIPLFRAPQNRSVADFENETRHYGWPSFRLDEIVDGNVLIKSTGEAVSKCGTHLGSNQPDEKGTRFCTDLVCMSGHAQ